MLYHHILTSVWTQIPCKKITIFSNNKQWVTKDLKGILNKKKRILFCGTLEEDKEVNKEIKRAVRHARLCSKNKSLRIGLKEMLMMQSYLF